ncbi:MAG: TrmH family RNA methyltransferase [Alteripontixanthobacter sp.]
MAFWAYMIRCGDGTYYIGHTDDLERRWGAHRAGEIKGYTSKRQPLELVWNSEFGTRVEALEAERKIKGWSRAKKEALIRGDWAAIQRLAKRGKSFETGQPVASPPQDERPSRLPASILVRPEERGRSPSISKDRAKPGITRARNPIIVLVRPQLGENIGKAARAMLNFGVTEMRLVAPRDGWPNPAAGPAAAGADRVLAEARVFDTTAEAVADCSHVYATTVRKREDTKPVVTPEQAVGEIAEAPGRSALLFGPERSGLDIQDVALARAILTVPINPQFGSLNLAQAVLVCAYEWSKRHELAVPTREDALPPAPQSELEGLIGHFEKLLEPKGYFFPENRREATTRTLRNVLTKPGWNHLEVRTLRGVLTHLARPDRPLVDQPLDTPGRDE